MTKITIKDQFGESRTYEGKSLKLWRDGNTVEVSYMKAIDGGADARKVIVAIASNPAFVDVVEGTVKPEKVSREIDPFTAQALQERPDTPEEKALLEGYKAIEGKKKRRGRPPKKTPEQLAQESLEYAKTHNNGVSDVPETQSNQ